MFFLPGQDRQGKAPGFGDVSSAMKAWGELMARPWPYGFGLPDAKSETPANAMIEAIVTAQQNALQLWLSAFGVSVEELGKPTRVPVMALPKPEPKAKTTQDVAATAVPVAKSAAEAAAKTVTVVSTPAPAEPKRVPKPATKVEVKAESTPPVKAPAKVAPAPKTEPAAPSAVVAVATAPAEPMPAPKVEAKAAPASPVKATPKASPVPKAEPVLPPAAVEAKLPVATVAPKPTTKMKPAPEPQIDPAGLFDDNAVTKTQPKMLTAPEGTADDLIKIKGIGPKLQKLLNDVGIWHYGQIAQWTPGEIAWINAKIDFKGRVQRERWVVQARELAGKS